MRWRAAWTGDAARGASPVVEAAATVAGQSAWSSLNRSLWFDELDSCIGWSSRTLRYSDQGRTRSR